MPGSGDDAAECVWVPPSNVERNQSAQRRAADERTGASDLRAVRLVHEGLHFGQYELCVLGTLATAALGVGVVGVLVDPVRKTIINANDDHRRNLLVVNQLR